MYEGGSPFIVPRAESDNCQKTNSLFIDRTYVRFDWCLLTTRQSPVQCSFSFFKYVLVLLILFPPQKQFHLLLPPRRIFFLTCPSTHHPSPPRNTLVSKCNPLSSSSKFSLVADRIILCVQTRFSSLRGFINDPCLLI
jgi:hypothetical protein